jgi:hypothetical protein
VPVPTILRYGSNWTGSEVTRYINVPPYVGFPYTSHHFASVVGFDVLVVEVGVGEGIKVDIVVGAFAGACVAVGVAVWLQEGSTKDIIISKPIISHKKCLFTFSLLTSNDLPRKTVFMLAFTTSLKHNCTQNKVCLVTKPNCLYSSFHNGVVTNIGTSMVCALSHSYIK